MPKIGSRRSITQHNMMFRLARLAFPIEENSGLPGSGMAQILRRAVTGVGTGAGCSRPIGVRLLPVRSWSAALGLTTARCPVDQLTKAAAQVAIADPPQKASSS
jgi:hypothetical protein